MRTVSVLLFLTISLIAVSAHALGVDDLIAKNVAARGGLDKIAAIKSLKMEGTLRVSGGFGSLELAYVQYQLAPNSVRIEATVQGLTQVQAWDGNEGWQISPFQGRRDPERLSADDVKNLADAASIVGALIGYRDRGSQIEYQGTQDIDGTQAHKLKVTLRNGDVQTVYLDPDFFLEIRMVTQRHVRGTQTEDITDYGDYERINGVYFPFSIATHSKDGGGQQHITIDSAQSNVVIDKSLFAFPAAAKVSQ